MNAVEKAIDKFEYHEAVNEYWKEFNMEYCLDCKHAYRRIDDADTLYCRLWKRKCPHVEE